MPRPLAICFELHSHIVLIINKIFGHSNLFRPMEIIVEYLEAKYLDKFLNSKLFQSYIKELISSIQVSIN